MYFERVIETYANCIVSILLLDEVINGIFTFIHKISNEFVKHSDIDDSIQFLF